MRLTGYCVGAEEVLWRVRGRGYTGQVVATGIPLMPAFSRMAMRREALGAFGLDHARPVVLVLGGGEGIGPIAALAEALVAALPDVQVVVVAGRNEVLRASLERIAERMPSLIPLGFVSAMRELMAAADVANGKPGGLTTAECLAAGLPLVAVSPLPGQEERNAEHLLECGAGLRAHDLGGAVERVRRLIAVPQRLRLLAEAARAAGRPDAADAVVQAVLGAQPTPAVSSTSSSSEVSITS